jgi:nicotinamidase-related amidase
MNMKIAIPALVLMSVLGLALSAGQEKPAAATIKPALLVIDIQNAFLPSMSDQDKKNAFEYINSAVYRFHQNGFPVILVYHTDPGEGPKPGTEAFEFPKSVPVEAADARIIKNFPNAFKKTDLEKVLREKGCNTLFLCGLSATGCVLATYHGALDHDYKAYVIQNALISPDSALTKAVESICESIPFSAMRLLIESVRR